MLNVDEFQSVNSRYSNNGSLDASILYETNESGAHVFAMTSSTIETSTGDAIRIAGLAGASAASLNLSLQGNAVVTHADFSDAVGLNWNGILLANAISNGLQIEGDHSTAFNIETTGMSLA